MIISHQHRFAFIKTRKTAGTSVEIALSRHLGPDDISTPNTKADEVLRRSWGGVGPMNYAIDRRRWGLRGWSKWLLRRPEHQFVDHTPVRGIRLYTNGVFGNYFIFTIDRNPWDLVVSAYSWRYRNVLERDRPSFREFVFSDALERYSNWPLYTIDDQVVVDEVIRYDQLESKLRRVSERLNLPALELPSAKTGHRDDQRPYTDWYDGHTRRRVSEVFNREIAYFGWQFGA